MTKERELLDLISDYVQARANIKSGVSSDAASLDEIAVRFGEVLRGESDTDENASDYIPPIITRSDEEARELTEGS